MDLIITFLIRLGLISGKSLDKALKRIETVDAYIEQLEAQERAKADAAQKVANRALLTAAEADAEAAKAAELRKRNSVT